MAFKTLVTNGFAQQLTELVQTMEASKGPFTLAMLVPSEWGLADKWNLVVSAKWIDKEGLEPAIPTITSSLLDHLSKINVGKIQRISPMSTKDSIVNDVIEEVDVTPGTAYRVQLFALNMRGIEEAIILAARRPSVSPNRQPQPVRARRG
ncbi:MAG TPA: hypothetical protein VKY85_27695 [Candidatus Angelobacter sp.]|nr:hypothetical protein [Candidatus Angelobacter sp.]